MQIGIMWGNPETTPGGKALKFYSSVRVDLRRSAQIKRGEEIIGNRHKAKIVKNKVAPPFKTAEFDIFYSEGISYEADIINTGLKYGLIKKSGPSLSFENVKLGQGFEAAKSNLKGNIKLRDEIMKKIREKLKEEAS